MQKVQVYKIPVDQMFRQAILASLAQAGEERVKNDGIYNNESVGEIGVDRHLIFVFHPDQYVQLRCVALIASVFLF